MNDFIVQSKNKKISLTDVENLMIKKRLSHQQLAKNVNCDIKKNYEEFMGMATYCYLKLLIEEIEKKIKELQPKAENFSATLKKYEASLKSCKSYIGKFKPTKNTIDMYGYIHAGITDDYKVYEGTGLYFTKNKAYRSLGISNKSRITDPEFIKDSPKYFKMVGHKPNIQGPKEKGGNPNHPSMNASRKGDGFFSHIHKVIQSDHYMEYGYQSFYGFTKNGILVEFYNPDKSGATSGKFYERGIKPLKIDKWKTTFPFDKRPTRDFCKNIEQTLIL